MKFFSRLATWIANIQHSLELYFLTYSTRYSPKAYLLGILLHKTNCARCSTKEPTPRSASHHARSRGLLRWG